MWLSGSYKPQKNALNERYCWGFGNY